MDAVDPQTKKMGAHGLEVKTEEHLGVNKINRKFSFKLVNSPKRSQVKGKGNATDVVRRDILAEIKVVQLTKLCAQDVTRSVISQQGVRPKPEVEL